MIKIFHHNDADGYAAAWAAVKHIKEQGSAIGKKKEYECIEVKYGDSVVSHIDNKDSVMILDFSVLPDEMDKILDKTSDVIWIDHHQSVIEKYENYSKHIEGVRKNGVAACVLTWNYFFPTKALPHFIELIADYDVWILAFEHTMAFQAYLYSDELSPVEEWGSFVDQDNLDTAIKHGYYIKSLDERKNKVLIDKHSYKATWGSCNILAVNTSLRGSPIFGDKIKDYDFVAVYSHDGEKFTCSLYSDKMKCVEYAKLMGGGGHDRACGFQCKELPWTVS